jgi:class 3 adenylate cyclase
MGPASSSTSHLDRDLQTRVLEFCKGHSAEFEVELNGYVRRYLLQSRMTALVAAVLLLSGPMMAFKTGHWIFAFTHVLSCILFYAYGPIAKRFDYFSRNAAFYCDLVVKVVTLESAWIFYQYHSDGAMKFIAGASPTLMMILIWVMNTYASTLKNVIHATVTTLALLGFCAWLDFHYLGLNLGGMGIGIALGAIVNSLIFRLFRYQFYFSQQEKNLRNHAYKQLEKMLYPHQRRMIEDGFTLEETMPVGYGEACVIAFDVIESSKIKSPYARTLLQNVLKKCQSLMMENYSQSDFEANAYRIKEMGDGFLCSVGYPFKTPGTLSKEALAIKLSQQFISIFHDEAAKLAPNERVNCAVGIASGNIEAFYPHTTPKEYDLYGRPLILATRYESIRKELFHHIPKSSIIILQESVHNRLPPQAQHNFQGFELKNFRIRDDHDAKKLFYQVFDDKGHAYAKPPNILTHAVS